MIEKKFSIPFVSGLALREKQIQQNYRPLIAVHKWFARRPGTLFRSLLLSEFVEGDLAEEFYRSQHLEGKRVADPFMGGGTPLIEANRVGCDSIGTDINPLAWWIVREQIEHLDLNAYRSTAAKLRQALETEVGSLYRTRCVFDGKTDAHVKYFLWVKVLECDHCKHSIDLFPSYLLAENVRHPMNVMVCAGCGELNEVADRKAPGPCRSCNKTLEEAGRVVRGSCKCSECGAIHKIPGKPAAPFDHRLFAIEYAHPGCKVPHAGRFFKKPDEDDLRKVAAAKAALAKLRTKFIPDDVIPDGDETARLHRWGCRQYRDMFNDRQLLGLEHSCRLIHAVKNERVQKALATNLSDLLRYQNMLCRYDSMALKSLDIFSVHGFPIGLIHAESNLLGVLNPSSKMPVGSGGWHNIIEKYAKAKMYCEDPFEIRHKTSGKVVVPMTGEWIGESRNGKHSSASRYVKVECRDSATQKLPPGSLDAVFTDPPYFGNVQYSELMDFCYVWLRKLMSECPAFGFASTMRREELTGNVTAGRGIVHFTEGLAGVFTGMAVALKKGSPLAFTFHHNDIKAYYSVAVAVLDSKLVCSATLPCPAEMGASIHITGTKSSIVDTVFVCRSTGAVPRKWMPDNFKQLIELIAGDISQLEAGGVKPTEGDARCVAYGHLIRLAIWSLRSAWDVKQTTEAKLDQVNGWLRNYCDVEKVLAALGQRKHLFPLQNGYLAMEKHEKYGDKADEIPF
ncbi:MAG: DNA methylase [bacterium]